MKIKLTTELKSMKEEFDFLHKKIGELEWERAIMFLGRRTVMRNEIERIDEEIEQYRVHIVTLIEKIKDEVSVVNQEILKNNN